MADSAALTHGQHGTLQVAVSLVLDGVLDVLASRVLVLVKGGSQLTQAALGQDFPERAGVEVLVPVVVTSARRLPDNRRKAGLAFSSFILRCNRN